MLTLLDYSVIAVYLIGVAAFGIRAGGRQSSTADYFLGSRDLPWWAVAFSVVATETSTLTVISVPAVSFLGTMTFLQITLGYLLGRIVVSLYLLPKYFVGEISTAYGFLGMRFGGAMRSTASVTFMVTRLLADGVRLFATAIPIKVIAELAGLEVSYMEIILVIGVITIIYTYIGGIKAVVWMDVVQMGIYVGGALGALVILLTQMPSGWMDILGASGKTQFIFTGFDLSVGEWLTEPYTLITAVFAGAVFSMASHGTDQLIVQRLLTCRSLGDSRKALVTSGFVIIGQFALFLTIGLLLWLYYGQSSLSELGLTRGDEIFPRFIIEGMPPGVSGLILAGILAAAMSTLSSSLNSLASSSVLDIYQRIRPETSPEASLRISRLFTLLWGIVFIVFANLFRDQQNPVVELGLAIASFTYGGLLGAFLLGIMNRKAAQVDALIAFSVTIVSMVLIIFGLWFSVTEQYWLFHIAPPEAMKQSLDLRPLGWLWYTPVGAAISVVVGSLSAALRGSRAK